MNRAIVALVIAAIAVVTIVALTVRASADDDTKELKLVHMIFRHGIRTPASTYPNDPYINETFDPIGWGQITNEGKLQLYETGQALRERYGHFLGQYYSPKFYHVQTTDVDRTKVSAQVINAALWPPVGPQKWGPLDWLPIPVHSEPLEHDNLLLVRKPCARYHIEKDKLIASDEVQAKIKENQEFFQELSSITGMNIKDFDDVQDVYSTLLAEETYNLTLPEWTKRFYPEKLRDLTVFSYTLNAYNDRLNRFKGGVLLKKLMKDWKGVIDGTLSTKSFLYVGHDSTVSNLLSTMKIWDPQVPDYGAYILMEFSQDRITKQYGLEIFFKNTTREAPYRLIIPGCESFCTLEKLERLTIDVVPIDWEEECKSDDPNFKIPAPLGP